MLTNHVNPFCGSGDAILPREGSLCAKWFFIKAQCGNTLPHAALPFSIVSAGAYNGAYPGGYGLNMPNYNGTRPNSRKNSRQAASLTFTIAARARLSPTTTITA